MQIHLTPSPAAYIRGGYDPDTQTTITVDLAALTEGQRTLLAEYTALDLRGQHRLLRSPHTQHLIPVTAPTTEAVLDAAAAVREADRARAEQAQAREQARVQAEIATMLDALRSRPERTGLRYLRQSAPGAPAEDVSSIISGPGVCVEYEIPRADWPFHLASEQVRAIQESADARAWQADLDARAEAARAQAVARLAAEWEGHRAREARDQRQEEDLRTWALEHGSDRMRLLLEEEHDAWRAIAEGEYLDAHTPEGFTRLPESYVRKDRTKPAAADILALREARALVEEDITLSAPEMEWIVSYRPADPDDEDEWAQRNSDGDVVAEKFAAITLVVTAPTGVTRTVMRRV